MMTQHSASMRATPTWITSVDELVTIFRDALAAVAPVLERAHIYSDDQKAYDDWDEIAQTLFDSIVARSIRWSEEAGADVDLGQYATLGQKGAEMPHLVARDGADDVWKSFHSIVSRQGLFDTVKILDAEGVAIREIGLEGARFALRVSRREGLIETLTVHL
jgi:hypothetical protein